VTCTKEKKKEAPEMSGGAAPRKPGLQMEIEDGGFSCQVVQTHKPSKKRRPLNRRARLGSKIINDKVRGGGEKRSKISQ